MSEKTLLDKGKGNYKTAEIIYKNMNDDPAYLIQIGFWLQQAIELAMRYFFDEGGVEVPIGTYDLDQLVRIAKEQGIDLHLTQYITEHTEMFTLWADRKDLPDYMIERWKVERAMEGVKEYLDFIDLAILYGGETFTTGLGFERSLRHALKTLEESEFAKCVREAILFGSCARGMQHAHSDVDLALIMPENFFEGVDDDTRRRFRLLRCDMSCGSGSCDPEVETCTLYKGWEDQNIYLSQCVKRDGKVVWKNPKYQDATL